jgi:hypothetical protein
MPLFLYEVMQVLRLASIFNQAVFGTNVSTNTVLKFASVYKRAAIAAAVHNRLHRWAAGIVNQAFQQVMGRAPTTAERQIVMAVSDLESNYGKGWKKEQGAGSHNWGAIQTRSKTNSFSHGDSSAQGKYITNFKSYPDDVAGAADVVRNLFKSNGKQRMPDPTHANRAMGAVVNGPGRAELIQAATQTGDVDAFSRAMWFTSYFEGTAPQYEDRIKSHANKIEKIVNSIASALKEPVAWSHQSPDKFSPVTNDIKNINEPQRKQQSPQSQQLFNTVYKNNTQDYGSKLESLLWQ